MPSRRACRTDASALRWAATACGPAFDPTAFKRIDITPTGVLVNGVAGANPSGRTIAQEYENFAKFYAFNRTFDFDLVPLAAVVTGLTLYNGSVVAELIRSGVGSLPKGQSEAGLSIGLTRGQTLRIIQIPQGITAMRRPSR